MQISFFEVGASYARLDKAGDPLLKLNKMISWDSLIPILKPVTLSSGVKGGRPSLDSMMMVKCLLLQSLYNISDESCEYQINDRLSFKRFLGLSASQKAPDEKTIWLFRERIKSSELPEKIFDWFSGQINSAGYVAQEGQIVDASFVPTHKPTGRHKKQLKEEIPLTSSQSEQIDVDATFTKKNNATHHGYKNHIQVDAKHKIIRKQITTTASVHDSQEFDNLVDGSGNTGGNVFADSAYRSAKSEAMILSRKLVSQVHERAYCNKPLSDEQKDSNRIKSKTRVRVEHIFGYMTTSMGGLSLHTIGLARAKVKICFKNIAYNMQRFVLFEARKLQDQCA
jgi:IS5 family transposase